MLILIEENGVESTAVILPFKPLAAAIAHPDSALHRENMSISWMKFCVIPHQKDELAVFLPNPFRFEIDFLFLEQVVISNNMITAGSWGYCPVSERIFKVRLRVDQKSRRGLHCRWGKFLDIFKIKGIKLNQLNQSFRYKLDLGALANISGVLRVTVLFPILSPWQKEWATDILWQLSSLHPPSQKRWAQLCISTHLEGIQLLQLSAWPFWTWVILRWKTGLTRGISLNYFVWNGIKAIEADQTQANCRDVGTYFLLELAKLRDEFPNLVGDVRGKGLMIGVELVSDPETRAPLAPADVLTIWEQCKDMGVLYGKGGFYGNVRL